MQRIKKLIERLITAIIINLTVDILMKYLISIDKKIILKYVISNIKHYLILKKVII